VNNELEEMSKDFMINFELLCRHWPGRTEEKPEVSVKIAGHQPRNEAGTS
jgi:hypothetical protein